MTFKNDSSQAERKAFVKDSYHNRYQDEAGGRWQKQTPTQVSGKDPATLYPKLPTTSPWSGDPVPPEEPLGIDVSEAPITGEPHEVAASLDRDFGLQRSLQNGVPPEMGSVIPAPPETTPGTEAIRATSADHSARQSPAVSGRHSAKREGGRVSPFNSIKRRLV
jgi:hypothetical protein